MADARRNDSDAVVSTGDAAAAAAAAAAAVDTDGSQYPIHLCAEPLRFSPVNHSTSVFFDEANQQVFTVREGATNVTVSSLEKHKNVNLSFPNRGPVISMKFSLDQRILAIQRTPKTIQFINLTGADTSEYSQSCRNKSSTHLLGFNWTYTNEIVLVTNQGIEFYQLNPEKRSCKLLKSYGLSVNWFVCSHDKHMFVLSTSPQANTLCPFQFKHGSVAKMSRFEVALPGAPQLNQKLLERDVTMSTIYGRLCLLIVKNNPRRGTAPKAEITVSEITKDGTVHTHTLCLGMNGRFALNVVQNLILVHHQASKTSMIFDLKWNQPITSSSRSTGVIEHYPIVAALPIAPVRLNPDTGPGGSAAQRCELYSSSWIVFQPDIVIDAKLGALWTVSIEFAPLVQMMDNKSQLVDLLLRRNGAKSLLLDVIRAALEPGTQCPLATIADIFDQLNSVCYAVNLRKNQGVNGERSTGYLVVDQSDMYQSVFVPLEDAEVTYKFLVSVLVEYIRSLNHFQIPVEHYLYELVINTLVRNNHYYQLHQFLQYHVVNDSKHVACLLLSLESTYAPAFQLALDMLKRLSNANEEIFEGLLSKGQLLSAMRFIRSLGPEAVESVSARRFLEAAVNTGDDMIFFTVFQFFKQRNFKLRKNPDFAPGEGCDEYVKRYEKLFVADPALPK